VTIRALMTVVLTALFFAVPASSAGLISVVVLFDVTFSVTPDHLTTEGRFDAAIRAIASQFQRGDSAVVGLVTSRVAFAPANRSSVKELTADWRKLLVFPPAERFGPSPLFDALDAGVSRARDLPGRRAVVLWTDGRPTGNMLGAAEAGARAADAGVSLNVIVDDKPWVTDAAGRRLGIDKPCEVFDAMTRMTGGVCLMNSRGTSAPVKQLEQILQQLRKE
jgi:hypothetical protein